MTDHPLLYEGAEISIFYRLIYTMGSARSEEMAAVMMGKQIADLFDREESKQHQRRRWRWISLRTRAGSDPRILGHRRYGEWRHYVDIGVGTGAKRPVPP